MNLIKRLYRQYIYGVMGTLLFHILLVSVFLLAEIKIKGVMKEGEVIIEIPELLIPEEMTTDAATPQGELISNNPADGLINAGDAGTNRPSNRLSASDRFFDEKYEQEVQSARNLVNEVNKQLSKEPVDIGNIPMPVETTDGMDPETIKNRNYSGESNVVYYLSGRYHRRLPIPVYLAKKGGRLVVEIIVNREGVVVEAAPQNPELVSDPLIIRYALDAAQHTLFNADISAPPRQSGTIHYNFIPQ